MEDFVESILAIFGATIVFATCSRALPRSAMAYLWAAFAGRVFFSFAQTAIFKWFYRGGADMFGYVFNGGRLARFAMNDPLTRVPQLFAACIGLAPGNAFPVEQSDSATGRMQALAGVFRLLHDSPFAVGLWFGLLSFTCQAFGYVAVTRFVEPRYEKYVRFAFLWTPSVAFWTASITKETVAMAGLSLFLYAFSRWSPGRVFPALFFAIAGGALIFASKPFLFAPLGAAIGAYGLGRQRPAKRTKRVSPLAKLFRRLAMLLVACAAVVGPGMIMPQFRADTAIETAGVRRETAARVVVGGSDISGVEEARSGLAYIPIGVVAALFRPFIFEARNFTQALNVIETTGILLLCLRMLFSTGLSGIVQRVLRNPELIFCLTFTLMTALVVGMASPNLGTISRYRAPMMPFYVLAILILNESTRRARRPVRSLQVDFGTDPAFVPAAGSSE